VAPRATRPGEPVEDLDQQFQDQIIRWLRWHRAMLLEDLVPHALRYLRLDPLAPELGEFDHVLVDEYQDLNRADMAVVELLARGWIAVGGRGRRPVDLPVPSRLPGGHPELRGGRGGRVHSVSTVSRLRHRARELARGP
jgi:superfamily I DNA/RNA helicase